MNEKQKIYKVFKRMEVSAQEYLEYLSSMEVYLVGEMEKELKRHKKKMEKLQKDLNRNRLEQKVIKEGKNV